MVLMAVRCPHCHSDQVIKGGTLNLSYNRLRVFRSANTAHLGRGVGQERWLRVGPSEKYAAC